MNSASFIKDGTRCPEKVIWKSKEKKDDPVEKKNGILVFIVHKSLKFHELKMHMHVVSIIAP